MGELATRRTQRVFGEAAERIERRRLALKDLHGFPDLAIQQLLSAVELGVKRSIAVEEAFAIAAEAARRTRGETPSWNQIVGGLGLEAGCIVELGNGEGKTLMATMPIFSHHILAARAKSRHGPARIITANPYLAKRDALAMSPVYAVLGLTIGFLEPPDSAFIVSDGIVTQVSMADAFSLDVLYADINEFVFTYLKAHLRSYRDSPGARHLSLGIFDECDSILLDRGLEPFVVNGGFDDGSVKFYELADHIVRTLTPDDFYLDERESQVGLTAAGEARIRTSIGPFRLFDRAASRSFYFYLHQALMAHHLKREGEDYLVDRNGVSGSIIPINEATGRPMPGTQLGELHPALLAKEGLPVALPSARILAEITIQSYFRAFEHAAGMTGTALANSREYRVIYGRETVQVPERVESQRTYMPDLLYRKVQGRNEAVVEEVIEAVHEGRSVLVGCLSAHEAQQIAEELHRKGLSPTLLTATHHESEAQDLRDAGLPGKVTVAAKLAGRGVDIVDHSQPGLHVIGVGRSTVRADLQLGGRTARRGRPGSVRFFLSLQDELLANFAPRWLSDVLGSLGLEEDMPVQSDLVTRATLAARSNKEANDLQRRVWSAELDHIIDSYRTRVYGSIRLLLDDVHADDITGQLARSYASRLEREMRSASTALFQAAALARKLYILGLNPEDVARLESMAAEERIDSVEAVILQRASRAGDAVGRFLVNLLVDSWSDFLMDADAVREQLWWQTTTWPQHVARYASFCSHRYERMCADIEERFVATLGDTSRSPE